ncbi:MAG: NapC/NirT family cytochrome c [Steroidobacteraceae bacterium]
MQKLDFAAPMRNSVSRVGAIVAVLCAILIIVISGLALAGLAGGLHLRIAAYLILPGVFVLGLALIPIGLWLQRRRERKAGGGATPASLPLVDLNSAATRRALLLFTLLGCGAVIILVGAGYQGVEVLESVEFCGQACHTTMQPEATAHARSPHANVACVTCHVGPGANWFVKSKINGLWEMVEVATNRFPRPIPTPIDNLRPARVVCEQCHWPSTFVGDRLVIHTHYGEDAANTQTKTVLMLHVGGQVGNANSGIHWHVGSGNRIRYLADPSREAIYTVELTTPDGAQKIFKNDAVPPVDAQWRTMDCVDCHNRPAHGFGDPAHEVDAALDEGLIDTLLPFIKREAIRVLTQQYPSQEQARAAISREITDFFRTSYPDVATGHASAVSQAGKALGGIWSENVFPQMKVTWNTYPNHIGHQQSPGCWRCHDNTHVAASGGEKIRKKCDLCHNLVAEDEAAPAVLKELE